jgi:ADP-heptose:LPS heptosyltransferase
MPRLLKRLELANKAVWKRVFRVVLAAKGKRPADLSDVRKILFIRHDRIGDMIVSTPLFRGIKEMRPGIEVGVLASPGNSRVVEADPNVDHIYRISRLHPLQSAGEIARARKAGYDAVVYLLLNDSLSGSIIANLVAPRGVKIARDSREHRHYYDLLVPIARENKHSMVELLLPFLRVFGPLPPADHLRPYVVVGERVEEKVSRVLSSLGFGEREPFILVNISAGKPRCRWDEMQCRGLIREILASEEVPSAAVIITDPRDREVGEAISREFEGKRARLYPMTDDLMEVACVIARAVAVVTPDTSIIHFASAMGTPVVGLYTRLELRTMEWQPYQVLRRTIFADEGRPVSSIPARAVYAGLVDLLEEAGIIGRQGDQARIQSR